VNYTDGSPCGDSEKEEDAKKPIRRKSMLISFLCDKDTFESSKPKVALSFIGASQDECHYSFEAKTPLACRGAAPVEQAVGPATVFGIMYSFIPSP
jgi:cation-dependent mannose-6-phosphate receptor